MIARAPTMSRRRVFALPAVLLSIPALTSIPAPASTPASNPILARKQEYGEFEAAMKKVFDPAVYVDYVTAHTDDCFAIYRGEKIIMYQCWLFQFDQGNNCDRFLAELNRRNWAYQTLPGESLTEAKKRIIALREREKIGVYRWQPVPT